MLGKPPSISAPQQEHSMQEHRVPLRESSNLNVLKAHDQANFIHWIAWDKTACFREEDRHSLWTLFLKKAALVNYPCHSPWQEAGSEPACSGMLSVTDCTLQQGEPSPALLPSQCQNFRAYNIPLPQQHAQKQVWDTFKAVLVPGLVYTSHFQKSSYLP